MDASASKTNYHNSLVLVAIAHSVIREFLINTFVFTVAVLNSVAGGIPVLV